MLGAGLVLSLIVVLARTPSNSGNWSEELAKTATATNERDGTVTLRNVRDFSYGDHVIVARHWIAERNVNPADIVRMWFVLEPFAAWKAAGHTYLTFEMKDGTALSFSIEARKQNGATYSPLTGMFNNYALTYTWGEERDFLTRRLLYLGHPVYMYPMKVSPIAAQAMFRALAGDTARLALHPRFYNTLNANCTDLLAETANALKPGAVPYDISWQLPGYADGFMAKIGYLRVPGDFATARERYDLTARRRLILAHAGDDPAAFSRYVRSLLPQ